MINWSDRGGAFLSANELESVLSHLKKMGLLGQNSAFFEGFSESSDDISLSVSELSWTNAWEVILNDLTSIPTDDVVDWVETIYHMDSISPSGFLYPLTRAQISNFNNGYKNAVADKKAGEQFIEIIKEAIQETLYEFGSKYSTGTYVFRIPLDGITIISASASVDYAAESSDSEGYLQIGVMMWNVEIDSNSIYKEVEE